ncbi:MAG: EAL domain-containing protein [Aquabacterium sp.]|uniref:putative bifunctional diguanylate cyclase/phosphodiesterase n=1 Tax=Aquabacterium sp. TaxID=1872578 RepID=UPI002725ED6A|nr:EAL domain-containing protein [Aquabacterium sp.]MDO9004884.1 EAL domain-containing protein [Aquabacterium sp.]
MPQDLLVVRHDGVAMTAAWFLAVYAIYVMTLVIRRVRASDRDVGIGWWIGGALTVGTGIWAQSFISMLSRQLPIQVGYLPAIVLAAWLPAVLICAVLIWSVSRVHQPVFKRVLSGLLAALGFGFLTYLNVSAMVLQPEVAWDPAWLLVAFAVILVGNVLASVMLRRELLREAKFLNQAGVAVVLGSALHLAQLLMLESAGVQEGTVCLSAQQLSGTYLDWLVSLIGGILLMGVQLGTVLDTRLRRQHAQLVSSLQQAQTDLQVAAHRDALTGLLNRPGFEHHLREVIQSLDESGEAPAGRLAVMRINLDGFRALVNTYGHALGDNLLRQVAKRLLVLVRNTDAPARGDGEEFLLLLPNMPDQHAVAQLAYRIGLAVSQPCVINGEDVTITCSIGIALYPDSVTVEQLICHANEAMLAASKAGGGVYCLHEAGMDISGAKQVEMQRELRYAIQRGELALHFQPKLDAVRGGLVGVEALLRWTHPQRGPVSPAEFIPVAERFGLIGELGQWVMNEACRHMRLWLDAGLEIPVAVNMSAHQLREHDLESRIRETLARHALPADMLILEITESVAMDDIEASLKVFDMLDRIGVKLSIDDFGTGYSSLSYLRRLPARQLKIDRSFVRDLDHSADAQAIVEAVVRLSHALGMTVVAEGVETEAQRQVLVKLACDELQGFLFAKPMADSDLRTWMGSQTVPMAPLHLVPA